MMSIRYAIEETKPDGSTMLWPVSNRLALAPPGFLGFRYPTWLSTTADALDMMRRSGWTMMCRAVVTSWPEGDE